MLTGMKTADKYFSIYIRIRDSDENGIVRCCTCGKSVHWKQAHNCHFIDRRHETLRFSEINCNAGCFKCNCLKDGNLKEYEKFLKSKHGDSIVDELNQAKHKSIKVGKVYFKEIAEFYKQKAKDLANFKRIQL